MPRYNSPGTELVVEVFTVGTSAAPLTPTVDRSSFNHVQFHAPAGNAVPIYIGGAGVTGASDGFPIAAGETTPIFDISGTGDVYAIAGSAAQSLVAVGVK